MAIPVSYSLEIALQTTALELVVESGLHTYPGDEFDALVQAYAAQMVALEA